MAGKPTKITLHCPLDHPARLTDIVKVWLTDGVELIAAFGAASEDVHDLIDDIIIRDSLDGNRSIVTTWHDSETLSEVINFVSTFGNTEATIKQVRL